MSGVTKPIILDQTGQDIAFQLGKIASAISDKVGVIDLSFYDVYGAPLNRRSTANSYAVRAVGIYDLPLVYGNAIKEGKANVAAYSKLVSSYTADFVNHKGNAITSPYIEENSGCVAASAGLLWQTASGMISNVQLIQKSDCKYIRFTVASVPSSNGLAVLYVKDGNNDIMWSWSIWCTHDALQPVTIVNHTEVEYDLLGVPFGAIWDGNHAHYVIPTYQWGRKDAMVPAAAYDSSNNMTVYDINGNALTWSNTSVSGGAVVGSFGEAGDESALKTVANSIKNPGLFFTSYDASYYNWNNLSWFNNFWNAAETADSSLGDDQDSAVKTIYDPSPVGYMLPAGRFATGFTTTGNNTSDSSEFNVVGSFANGWNFKKNDTDTEGFFIPAAGCRDHGDAALGDVGSDGYFWTFAPLSQGYARGLYFGGGYVYPLLGSFRALGFAVWGVRELN